MKYFIIILFSIFILSGCASTSPAVPSPVDKAEISTEVQKKPIIKVIKYKEPVVFREIRKYHTGEIDIYKTFEYEKGTDNLLSSTTFDSAEAVLDYFKSEKSDGIVKQMFYNKSDILLKTKLIKFDSSNNIIETTMLDISNNQISRSEYEYTDKLKSKWNIYDSKNVLLAYNTYSYDHKGNNTEIKSYSPSGNLEESFSNIFNNDGMITSIKHFDSKGNLIDSSEHIYENGLIKEENFYKGEKTLQRKKIYTYNKNNSIQTCKVSIAGGQIIEIIEKEFFFIEKEKTIVQ